VCFLLVLVGANVYMYLRVARGGTASKEPAARFVPLPRPTTKLVRRLPPPKARAPAIAHHSLIA
jgi:hypothetical protein